MCKFLLILAFTLVFSGAVLLSHVSKGLTKPSDAEICHVANLADENLTRSNSVEVDGIWFQPLMTDYNVDERATFVTEKRRFSIPIEENTSTTAYIILQVANNRSQPVRFPRFGFITPSLITADGQPVQIISHYINGATNPAKIGSVLLQPGESINLRMGVIFSRQNNKIFADFGTYHQSYGIIFIGINSGNYKLQLTYRNQINEISNELIPEQFDVGNTSITPPQPIEVFPASKPREVWQGTVTTPLITFCLVQ